MTQLSISNPKLQRLINGLASLVLTLLCITKYEYVSTSSNIREHYILNILLVVTLIYIVQTIINKRWLNRIIFIIYSLMLTYVIASYIYFWFDTTDYYWHQENGVMSKTIRSTFNAIKVILALWLTDKLMPQKV